MRERKTFLGDWSGIECDWGILLPGISFESSIQFRKDDDFEFLLKGGIQVEQIKRYLFVSGGGAYLSFVSYDLQLLYEWNEGILVVLWYKIHVHIA